MTNHYKVGMMFFLLTFLVIYGGIHWYIFIKIKNAFPLESRGKTALALFMLVMIFAPIIVRILEKAGYEFMARLMAYTGYTWTGLAFLFLSVAILFDFYRVSVYVAGLITGRELSFLIPSHVLIFSVACACAVVALSVGYFEAQNIRTERIVLTTPKIPQSMGRLKIVQISDVHLGLIVRERRLAAILREVERIHPDILVSTGDLIDGQICNMDRLIEMFNAITPPYGKFAVTGNHEFYAGLSEALTCTEKSGFTILRNEGLSIPGVINIVGVDDPTGRRYENRVRTSEGDLLRRYPGEEFTLFLKHQPVVDPGSLGLFDLQLSGHAHKGQIFPFTLLVRLRYPLIAGYFMLPKNSPLYVSRGTGTWGPPMRFMAPPEVTVIEIVHERAETK
jgi:predicted MPP superfamily phosphohydrolase